MSTHFSYTDKCKWDVLGRFEHGSSIDALERWLDTHQKTRLDLGDQVTLGGFIAGLVAVGKLKQSESNPRVYILTPSGRRELRRLSDKAIASIVI